MNQLRATTSRKNDYNQSTEFFVTRRLSLGSEEQLCCFNKSSPCDKNKATSLATQQVIFLKTFI